MISIHIGSLCDNRIIEYSWNIHANPVSERSGEEKGQMLMA